MWDSDWTIGEGYAKMQKFDADIHPVQAIAPSFQPSHYDGQKYPGGLGAVIDSGVFDLDYWGLRSRSNELFHKNAYARGIIRRLVTEMITTGLHLEATPDKSILGIDDDFADDWSSAVESRYFLYNNTPHIIDYKKQRNGGELQRQIRRESMIGGDCLVILRQHPKYKLPTVQIVSGERIVTPMDKIGYFNIVDGVELDDSGRHIAYHIAEEDKFGHITYKRILARGGNTGRIQAKLVYGCDKREDGVRGVPLLGIAIQPLAEIDKYRDSAQRKATLNSVVVAAIKRGPQNKRQTNPIMGSGPVRRDAASVEVTTDGGDVKTLPFTEMVPGANWFGLAADEDPVFFNNNGVDMNFGGFEAAIIMGLAWALEIPPEILLLSFNKNYSASQAAMNQFNVYLDKERERFANDYLNVLYQDWFLSMVLLNRIEAGSFLSDLNTYDRWEYARAWTLSEWFGQMKPTTDMLKTVNAWSRAVEEGFTTRSRAARAIFNMKFSNIAQQLKKENQQWADTQKPIGEIENQFGKGTVAAMRSGLSSAPDYVEEVEQVG
jgi:capsid protein